MKVLMPINPESDIDALIENGMGEGYIGFEDSVWRKNFGEIDCINRMSNFGSKANFRSIQDVKKICRTYSGMPFFVTVNSASYSDKEVEFLTKMCSDLYSCGVAGIIAADPYLIKTLCEESIPVVVSTIAGVYNSQCARYYKDMGVKRIILPRDLSLMEMEMIVSKVPLEYEAFLMSDGCRYSDSACLGRHAGPGSMCYALDHSMGCTRLHGYEGTYECVYNNFHLFHDVFHKKTCGLCSIYSLGKLGIHTVKIVGRAGAFEENLDMCKKVSANIRIADECGSEQEYLDKMEVPEYFGTGCENGLFCYYPETRY